jgi:Na+/proline symporter
MKLCRVITGPYQMNSILTLFSSCGFSIILFLTAMGCGILTTYTQIANIAGIQGLLVYVLAGAVPIVMFSFLGPLIRRRCPEGFVLTEWCYQRYGPIMALCLSAATVLTLYLFMVSELTALGSAISALTGLDPTPCIVVEAIVTTIYTSMGGFAVSFVTDTFQAIFVLVVIVIGIIGYATEINIDLEIKHETYHQLMGSNKLGWMVFYILNVAILTNDMFMSGFWLRTFAAKTDKDLYIATSIAAVVVAIISTLVGLPGIIAVWTGDMGIGDDMGYNAFFILCGKMDKWIIGVILIFSIFLSTCTFDSLQSATTSSISNDLFRNKFPIIYSRILVILIMIPALVVAIKASANVLQIYFIADLLSSAIVPVMFLGLSKHFFFLRGLDVIVGALGSLLAIFVFGCIYYGTAKEGGYLLLIWNGVYDPNDWGAFGAFVIAPVGGIIFGLMCAAARISIIYLYCKRTGKEFHALDMPTSLAFGVTTKEEGVYEPATSSEPIEVGGTVDDSSSFDENSLVKSLNDDPNAHVNVREIVKDFQWKDMLHLLV